MLTTLFEFSPGGNTLTYQFIVCCMHINTSNIYQPRVIWGEHLEPERAPNTRETALVLYVYYMFQLCGVIISGKRELIEHVR